jgi:hypothetical protein
MPAAVFQHTISPLIAFALRHACRYQESGPRGGGGGAPPAPASPVERPKLALKPRSADSPGGGADGGAPAPKVNPFGAAKANDASKVRIGEPYCRLGATHE